MGRIAEATDRLVDARHARSLDGATGWVNTPPLALADLRGKVVAIQFGTYTCINWIRTLPYVRAWARRYADQGLVVLGIHTPEFSIEKDEDNVRRALRQMNVRYPVALDNDYAVWDAFANRYWPALYVIDAEGRMRYQWFGEGEYERSERSIRQLLAETGADGIGGDLVWVGAHGVEADADWNALRSPETYLGLQRAERFRSRRAGQGEGSVFTAPGRLLRNEWTLSGAWTLQSESVISHESGGRIAFRFHARDVHLVMGPVEKAGSVAFRVWLDGEPPGEAHGLDVDADGASVATDQRMYQLIRQPSPIVDRTLEVQFLDPGVEAFVFTFG